MNKLTTIYLATNLLCPTKHYIGFDSNWPDRKKDHFYTSFNENHPQYGCIFHKAIRKYGWDNFQWQIIYQSPNVNHCLYIMERYYIQLYDSYYQWLPKGYNMTLGGEGALGLKREVWNKGLSLGPMSDKNRQALKNAMQDFSLKEHLRKKAIEQFQDPIKRENHRLGRLGDKNPAFGKIWIHKENNHKRIDPNQLMMYIEDGWIQGRIFIKKEII